MTATLDHRQPVARPQVVTTVNNDGVFGWRMLAANGRPLAASVQLFPDADTAEAAFQALVQESDLAREISHPPSGVGWTWLTLDPDGTAVAMAARDFGRRDACLRSYEQFLHTLRTFAPLAY
ncbi:hypothetical protein [Rugosimonospora africana]|uniref:DUF1508 domain-containing protein n=1 Tax=Rugosimonospora africana TaxID=556532 RepID=A0A8J3R1E5_9ACTN|nr:hypothetical protein [Rugosimonospora africana]GIH19838.1 hypothetical protein Raf01_80100 [Rugosimonospora africana]